MKIKNTLIAIPLLTLIACGGGETPVDGDTPPDGGDGGSYETGYVTITSQEASFISQQDYQGANTADALTSVGIDDLGNLYGERASDTPNSDAVYTGTGVYIEGIADTTVGETYDLSNGTVTASFDVDGNTVSILLSEFTPSANVSDANHIASVFVVSDAMGSGCSGGAHFCGVSSSSGQEPAISRQDGEDVSVSADDIQMNGAFFGSNAAEIGGYVSVDDDQNLRLNAPFIGSLSE